MILAGADAVIIGEDRYGLRLPGEVKLNEIGEAVSWAHERKAKVYVAVNNILDNQTLEGLKEYLAALQSHGVDAIIFGDPAVVMTVRQLPESLPLHWNAEMTSTNYATANYWGSKAQSCCSCPRAEYGAGD